MPVFTREFYGDVDVVLGLTLRKIRLEAGCDLVSAAALLGVSSADWRAFEAGSLPIPGHLLFAAGKFFECPPERFMERLANPQAGG